MAIKSKTGTMPQDPTATVAPAPTHRTGPGHPEAPQQQAGEKRRGLPVKSGVITGGCWQWHALDLQLGFCFASRRTRQIRRPLIPVQSAAGNRGR